MKKKKTLILSVILGLAAAFIFAGCSDELTVKDLENRYENDPNYVKVTFKIGEDAVFNGRGNMDIYYYYKKDADGAAKVLEPGSDAKDVIITKAGSFIEGWYTDEACKNKWNFATDRTDKSMVLYAKWLPHFRFDICIAGERGDDNGKVLSSLEVAQGGTLSESATVMREDHTLLGLFSDEACTIPWDYSYTHKGTVENGESVGTVEKVYSKWIKGIYSLVREASDFGSFNENSTVNYWLMNNIDFADSAVNAWGGFLSNYGGIIEGNGYSVKNIKILYKSNMDCSKSHWGLFRTVTETAKIKNVKFENVSIEIENAIIGTEKTVGLFAGRIDEGAEFQNVAVSGNINVISVKTAEKYTIGLLVGENNGDISKITYNTLEYPITVTSESYIVTVNGDKVTLGNKPQA